MLLKPSGRRKPNCHLEKLPEGPLFEITKEEKGLAQDGRGN